jgi:hypothetical protein
MNTYRLTFVNPAFAPRPSRQVVSAPDARQAIAEFWKQVNPACVLDRRIHGIERQVTVIDGRSPHGRTEWRSAESEVSR